MLNVKAVKLVRQYLGWTLKDLAKRSGVSYQYLGRIEGRELPLTSDIDEKLKLAFLKEGISEDDIFKLVCVMHEITKGKGDKNKCNNN